MSWRDIPGFPGYQINRRGMVRKNTGYVLSRNGTGYNLWLDGRRQWVSGRSLREKVFPPEGAAVSAGGGVMKARPMPAVENEFAPLPGYPGFEINRAGVVRDAQGNPLFLYSKREENVPFYRLNGRSRRVNGLLYEAFGPGAAGDAGWPEPGLKQMAAAQKPRPVREEVSAGALRRCHDCGRPTVNYRCEACWRKMRGYGQEGAAERASGTLWDEF